MKTSAIFTSCLLLALLPAAGRQPAMGRAPTRDAASHDELAARRLAAGTVPQEAGQQLVPGPEWKPGDLMARSQAISFRGFLALVPKGAVLHVPAGFQARLQAEPEAKLLPWSEFLALNRGWIQTCEVSLGQASGKLAIAEPTSTAIERSSFLVVATLKGGPVSVRTPDAPPVTPQTACNP